MNKGFGIVWNEVRRAYVVVSELAKRTPKSARRARIKTKVGAIILACVAPITWAVESCAPTGPNTILCKATTADDSPIHYGNPIGNVKVTIEPDSFSYYFKANATGLVFAGTEVEGNSQIQVNNRSIFFFNNPTTDQSGGIVIGATSKAGNHTFDNDDLGWANAIIGTIGLTGTPTTGNYKGVGVAMLNASGGVSNFNNEGYIAQGTELVLSYDPQKTDVSKTIIYMQGGTINFKNDQKIWGTTYLSSSEDIMVENKDQIIGDLNIVKLDSAINSKIDVSNTGEEGFIGNIDIKGNNSQITVGNTRILTGNMTVSNLGGQTEITNTGTLTGNLNISGIETNIKITNKGTLTGDLKVSSTDMVGNPSATVTNAGTISGTVDMSNLAVGNVSYIAQAGSTVGKVVSNKGTLELLGEGSTQTTEIDAEKVYTGFATLNVQGGSWALGGKGTYTGVNATNSILYLNADNNLGAAIVKVNNNELKMMKDTLNLSNDFYIENILTVETPSNYNLTLSGYISETGNGGGLRKTGPGTLTFNNASLDENLINTLTIVEGQISFLSGTLKTAKITGEANARLILAGSILQPTQNNETFLSGFSQGEVTLKEGTSTRFDTNGYSIGISAGISGTGGMHQEGNGTLTFSGKNTYTGSTIVNTGKLITKTPQSVAPGAIYLGQNATYALNFNEGYTFNNPLSGAGGTLAVNLGSNQHDFVLGKDVGNEFTGTLALENTAFDLATGAENALQNATLSLQTGSIAKVNEKAELNQLVFDGGTVQIAMQGNTSAGLLSAKRIDVPALGTVQVKIPTDIDTMLPNQLSLIDQSQNAQSVPLIAGEVTMGVGAQLKLLDEQGNALVEDRRTVKLTDEGVTKALATYNYSANVQTDGVKLGYSLTQLDLPANQTFTLSDINATATTFGAKITGSGDLILEATKATPLGLANAANDYTGSTTVRGKTVQLGTDNALGKTSELIIESGATVDVNGRTQILGKLTNLSEAIFNLNQGHVTLTQGGSSQGILTGSGTLTFAGGDFVTNRANYTADHRLDAAISIESGASASITHPRGLGMGPIHLAENAVLNLNGIDGPLANTLSGSGLVNINKGLWSSWINLEGINTEFSGRFSVAGDSTLVPSTTQSLGTADVYLEKGSQLLFMYLQGETQNALSGQGTVKLQQGAYITATGESGSFSGLFEIEPTTTLIAQGTQSLGTAAIEFKEGDDYTKEGTLVLDIAEGSTLSNIISGMGRIEVPGKALLTGDSSGFSGTTTVSGVLSVNGQLGGTLSISNGGRLQGSGNVGPTTLASGATLAPGNSIGTLTIEGDLLLNAGSVFEAEIDPAGQSDQVYVKGAANVQSNLSLFKPEGRYYAGTRYTLLTADNGVTGGFVPLLIQDLPFVDLLVSQDTHHIYLDVTRNSFDFDKAATSKDQGKVARAIESLGVGNALYDEISSLPNVDSARKAFKMLSGEMFASTHSFLLDDPHVRNAALNRLARKPSGEEAGLPNAWGQSYGAWGHYDGQGDTARLTYRQNGVLVGTDSPVENWRIGAIGGYAKAKLEIDDRNSRSTIGTYHAGLYAGTAIEGWHIRLGGAYSRHKIETKRNPDIAGKQYANHANYHAHTLQAFGEVGHPFALTSMQVEPFVRAAYVRVKSHAFQESGSITALSGSSTTDNVLFTTLGVRANKTLTFNTTDVMLQGNVGWRHAYHDIKPSVRLAFAGSQSFGMEGVPIAEDMAVLGIGVQMKVGKNANMALNYAGLIGKNAQDNSVQANFIWKF
jgi:outer membrane autotransporter protein